MQRIARPASPDGTLRLHRRAAGVFIAAWADVEALFPVYRHGAACGFCLRHMNWDPAQPLTVHASGFAVDVDFDDDGAWERHEQTAAYCLRLLQEADPGATQAQADAMAEGVYETLESWGLVLGLRWHGASEDDMHHQYATI